MHEISIAAGILENAVKSAHGHGKIKRISLLVGCLLMLNPDQLRFGFEMLAKNTPAENAKLEIEVGKAKLKCSNGHETCVEVPDFDLEHIALLHECGICGAKTEILGGRELILKEIVAE